MNNQQIHPEDRDPVNNLPHVRVQQASQAAFAHSMPLSTPHTKSPTSGYSKQTVAPYTIPSINAILTIIYLPQTLLSFYLYDIVIVYQYLQTYIPYIIILLFIQWQPAGKTFFLGRQSSKANDPIKGVVYVKKVGIQHVKNGRQGRLLCGVKWHYKNGCYSPHGYNFMQGEVKTSVKVHHQPGGESNWKLGWTDEKPKKTATNKYHNQSNIVFGESNQVDNQEQEEKKEQEKRKKDEQLNKQLPDFNPKLAGQSSITFQSDSQVDQQRVRQPPGGKSNIQFG